MMQKPYFTFKEKFLNKFKINSKIVIGNMFFRLYNPIEDEVVSKYSNEDWRLIFANTTENNLKELNDCANVVILIWCELQTNAPQGMMYFEESANVPTLIIFHGGTWDHDARFVFPLYKSVVNILDIIIKMHFSISTSCNVDNSRADKWQNSIGFEEINVENNIRYKKLNVQNFYCSKIVDHFLLKQ